MEFIIISFLYFSGLVLTRGILIHIVEPENNKAHLAVFAVSMVWPILALFYTFRLITK